jgi:hypothetical protein
MGVQVETISPGDGKTKFTHAHLLYRRFMLKFVKHFYVLLFVMSPFN